MRQRHPRADDCEITVGEAPGFVPPQLEHQLAGVLGELPQGSKRDCKRFFAFRVGKHDVRAAGEQKLGRGDAAARSAHHQDLLPKIGFVHLPTHFTTSLHLSAA